MLIDKLKECGEQSVMLAQGGAVAHGVSGSRRGVRITHGDLE